MPGHGTEEEKEYNTINVLTFIVHLAVSLQEGIINCPQVQCSINNINVI